jgi:hypothetical protein
MAQKFLSFLVRRRSEAVADGPWGIAAVAGQAYAILALLF